MNAKNFLWITPFLSFAAGYLIMHQLFSQSETITPTLTGKPIHEVLAIVTEKNLNLRLIDQKEESALPEGIILHQTPFAGSSIKSHQPIFIVISKKPETMQSPLCIGYTIDTIHKQLIEKGIQAHIYYLPHAYPEQICFAQSPPQGEFLEKNKLILYVSSGNNKPIIWPDFKHESYEKVAQFLSTYTITPQIISGSAFIQDNYDYKIIDQRPFAGTLLTLDEDKPLSVQLRINS